MPGWLQDSKHVIDTWYIYTFTFTNFCEIHVNLYLGAEQATSG